MINYFNTLVLKNRSTLLSFKRLIPNKSRKQPGFTLIELMVVIVIISILAAFVAPKLMHRADEAKVTEAKIQIKNLETGLRLFKMDNGFYPSTEQGLQALITAPEAGEIPENYRTGGYLEKRMVPLDPWGNSYMYVCPGVEGDYDIFSYGADGAAGGDKYDADIVNWEL
jgi:general secretion pathway protein G